MSAPGFLRLSEGLHHVSDDVYHGDPCVQPSMSAGLAHLMISKTPLHAWTASPRLNPYHKSVVKDEFDFGDVAHQLITGKGKGIREIKFDSYRTQEAKDKRDMARALGYTPLLTHQLEEVELMVDLYRRQMSQIGVPDPFKDKDKNELTGIAKIGNVWCRAKVDTVNLEQRIIYDYKTSVTSDPDEWVRKSMAFGIDLRVAHYQRVFGAIFPGEPFRYRFPIQEKTDPYTVAYVELGPLTVALGHEKWERAHEMWDWCIERQTWPGRDKRIAIIEAPSFHESEWVARRDGERQFKQKHSKDVMDAWYAFQQPLDVEFTGEDL